MDEKHLKQVLASVSLISLIAGTSMSPGGLINPRTSLAQSSGCAASSCGGTKPPLSPAPTTPDEPKVTTGDDSVTQTNETEERKEEKRKKQKKGKSPGGTRTKDQGTEYEDVDNSDGEPPYGGPDVIYIDPISTYDGCLPEGVVVFPDNFFEKSSWELMASSPPPQSEIKPVDERGSEEAREGAEGMVQTFKTINEVLKAADKIIPGGTGIVGGAAQKYMDMAEQTTTTAAEAADRWTNNNPNKPVTVTVTVHTERRIVKCKKAHICTNGKWLEGGLKPVEEEVNKGRKIEQTKDAIGRTTNKVAKSILKAISAPLVRSQMQYNVDPCSKASASGGGGTAVSTGGDQAAKNCQPILDQIRAKEGELKTVTNAHAEAQIKLLDLKIAKSQAEIDRLNEKAPIQEQLSDAENDLKQAETRLNQIDARIRGMSENPGMTPPDIISSLREEANRAHNQKIAAQERVNSLQNPLKSIDQKYDSIIQSLNQQIEDAKEEVENLANQKQALENEIENLWNQYNKCLYG